MGIIDEAIKTGELPVSAEAVPCEAGGQGGYSFTRELDRQERDELYRLRQEKKDLEKRIKELEGDLYQVGRRCEIMKSAMWVILHEKEKG